MFRRLTVLAFVSFLLLQVFSASAQERQYQRLPAIKEGSREQYRPGNNVGSDNAPRSVINNPMATDMLVNDNAGAGTTGNFTQSETDIVAFGNNVVIGFNDAGSYNGSNNHFTGWAYSTNGGTTFTDGGTLPLDATIGDAGDPVLARNESTGRIYLSTLGFSGASTIQMWRSDDNGITWMAPVNATPGGSDEDKQWHTVDNFVGSGNGNVYVISRRFSGTTGIYAYRSTDHGATFSAGVSIVSGNQGGFIAVGPDHSVYAFWYAGTTLQVRKSTDFGVTYGSAVTVASGLVGGTNGDLGLTGIRQGTVSASSFRSSEFPHVAINPVSGNIYVTFNNDGAGADKADIFLVQSTDGGTTWSAATKVNDDVTTTDQWQPTIAVTPDGAKLGIFYYSRQDSANNNSFRYYGRVADISGSTVTFSSSFAISDVPSLPEFGRDAVINATYMGDYNHAVATTGAFHVVWSDNRSDLAGGAGRKDPNVYYEKIVVGDPVDPNPPTGVTAYSQFSTPTSIQLNWTNPTTLVNGSPIGSFVMRIKRDGVQITEVTPPTTTYNDGGRTTYQQYAYTLETRLTSNDSLSSPVQVSWIAGGSPYPSAPSGVGISITGPAMSTQATISWTNPTTQKDGTPIHDFGGTRIWRNGVLRDSVGSGVTQYIDTPPPGFVYTYYLQAYNTLTPRRYSDPSASVGGYVGSLPDILVWQPADVVSNSADSIMATLTRLGKSCFKTDSLFEFGSDLSSFDAIFAIMGTYSNNHVILATDPEGPALDSYVSAGGKLYLEGADVFNYDPESASGYQVRPIFGLNDGADGGSDVNGGITGLGLLAGMNFAYSGSNFMDELHPAGDNAARTMFIAPSSSPVNDTMSVYAFYGLGRSVAMVPEFGNMVNTLEAGNRDSLVSKILQFFNASQSPAEIDVTPLALADTLQSNQTSSLSFTISNTTIPPATGLIVGISESVGWLSVSPTADTIGGASNSLITVNFNATGLTPATYNTNIVVTSNDSNEPTTNVAVTLLVTGAPTIVTRPDSIVVVLPANTTSTDTLTIKNTGLAPLTWSISDNYSAPNTPYVPQIQGDQLFPPRRGRDGWPLAWGKDEFDPSRGPDVVLGSGGPDSAGYRWIDSDEPGGPTFNWTDITGVGTPILTTDWVGTADDGRKNVGLPFTFTFYGVGYDSLKICTNGWVGFDRTSINAGFTNAVIPTAAEPNNTLFGFWDDFDLRTSGQVHYYNDGANSRFIVQYTNAPHYTGTTGTYTFQIIIYADGRILYQYLSMVGTVNSSTIGIESPGGTVGLPIVFNAAYVHDNLAVLIAKDVPWVSEGITSGTVNPGDSIKVPVIFNSNGLSDGDYTAELQINNNDGAHNPKIVPLHMIVGASSVGVTVLQGWNIISNPVSTANDSVQQVFPSASFAYAFDYTPGTGYAQKYELETGKGYWEKFGAGSSFSIPGTFIQAESLSVIDGWNIVGSLSTPFDTSNISTVPSGLRASPFYGFNGGYVPVSTIIPGSGYWMKANGSGTVILSTTFKAKNSSTSSVGVKPFEGYSSITIRDNRGGSQTLYIGKDAGGNHEMPPAGPVGIFDARFDSQRMVETIDNDLHRAVDYPITLQSTAYPVTVSWNVKPEHRLALRDGITGSIMSARSITGAGQMSIISPSITRLVLSAQPDGVPASFGLDQNFPNPFNPTTQIGYALPEATNVTLRVFDILGQEVFSLATGPQNAGYYNIEWNGKNNAGSQLASGIYFYRLEAAASSGQLFRMTRKMTLMK